MRTHQYHERRPHAHAFTVTQEKALGMKVLGNGMTSRDFAPASNRGSLAANHHDDGISQMWNT